MLQLVLPQNEKNLVVKELENKPNKQTHVAQMSWSTTNVLILLQRIASITFVIACWQVSCSICILNN